MVLSGIRLTTLGIASLIVSSFAYANGDIIGAVDGGSGRVEGAVVYLTKVSGSFSAPSKQVIVDQRDKEFVPHVLAIMKGTTIRFSNSDPYLHNVFSSSRVQAFNVSQTKKGDYSDVTFDKIGLVPIKCHIHANMKAYIVVCPNPYFATTNGKGLFEINDVPPGNYTINVWSEKGTATAQTIQVPSSGRAKVVFKIS